MNDNNQVATINRNEVFVSQPMELSVDEVLAQVEKIQKLMKSAMKPDEHYGVIPGTNSKKPTLLKAGAEKLCFMFRLDPQYEIEQRIDGDHLTIVSRCILYHIPTGSRVGSGMGLCSTHESKYAYRKSERICPDCDQPNIKVSKPPRKGFYCWEKTGGCGANFPETDERITSQVTGRVDNPDMADQYNTVLKMANKRSLVAAVLNATAASDIFTQDLEDIASHRRTTARDADDDDGESQESPPVAPLLKDTDKAPAELRARMTELAQKKFGAASKDWLHEKARSMGVNQWRDANVGHVKAIIEAIVNEVNDAAVFAAPLEEGE